MQAVHSKVEAVAQGRNAAVLGAEALFCVDPNAISLPEQQSFPHNADHMKTSRSFAWVTASSLHATCV
eukprot:2365620-Rhodomonas_salina.2